MTTTLTSKKILCALGLAALLLGAAGKVNAQTTLTFSGTNLTNWFAANAWDGSQTWTTNNGASFTNSAASTATLTDNTNVASLSKDGSGNLAIASNTTAQRTFTFSGGNINGQISINDYVNLQGNYTKVGGNTLLHTGSNKTAYSGIATVNGGVLRYDASPQLGTSSNFVVNNTGELNLWMNSSVSMGAVTVNTGGIFRIGREGRDNDVQPTITSLSGTGGTITTWQTQFNPRVRTLTVNQSTDTVYGGQLTGTVGSGSTLSTLALTKQGAGILTLTGNNTYIGATTISGAGGIQLGNGGTTGRLSASSAITNNAILRFNRSNAMTQGTDFSTAGIGGSGQIQQNGTGTVTFNAVNSYTGATTVNAGTLLVSAGSINSTSSITVNDTATFSYSSSTGLNRNVTLNTGGTFVHNGSSNYTGTLTWNGGTLAGTNFSGVSLNVGANKTLSPGNSPGTMTSGNQTWADGGNYNLQIFDLSLAAGTGFDTIAITGTLDLTGLSAGGFNINMWSLSSIGPDVNGDALNFNNLAVGSWQILSTTGGITGFDAANFTINVGANNGTGGFSNALGGGTFSIAESGGSLFLEFTPIPEPSTSALLLAGGGAFLYFRNRKTRAA